MKKETPPFPCNDIPVLKRRAFVGTAATGFRELRCEFLVWDVATKQLVPTECYAIFVFDGESKRLVAKYRIE